MQYQSFLIKYAEIGTKGKNRFMFEDALIKQIRFALREVDGSFEVTKESGRIYVTAEGDYDYDDTIEALKRVFGIADICPMVQIDDRDYENLKKHVVEYMDKVYPDKNLTFKVVARRGDKRYPVSSDQINRDMGEAILEAFPQMRVDVHNPDVLLRVEIRQKVNIFSLMIPGPGGMPVGTNGKAMLLLSGGIDSPVAGYMMRIAQAIAEKNGAIGLITGESIGQVASQTLQSLAATNEVCTMPVYRPVIGFDKQEIVDVSEKIGTYETSIQPFEDCCTIFVAKHPVTKPNINVIRNSERHLEEKIDELVKTALETTEVIRCQ